MYNTQWSWKLFIFLIFYVIGQTFILNINKTSLSLEVSARQIHRQRRIFDTFMYNNEGEAAYVRVWRHAPFVDKFVIVVSNKTHSGAQQHISFEPFTKEMEQFKDKIVIAYHDGGCDPRHMLSNNVWCRERTQRDFGVRYIEKHFNPTQDDIILVSDCDEIFTREALRYFREYPPNYYFLVHGVYYFPIYFHRISYWDAAMVMSYHPEISPSEVRSFAFRHNKGLFFDPGKPFVTHCSYCFRTLEEYKRKLQTFTHQEFNKPPYTTNNWIFKSHYCRFTVNQKSGYDEPDTDYHDLIPDDERLRFLYDPSYEYDLKLTTYKESDLPTLCSKQWRRSL